MRFPPAEKEQITAGCGEADPETRGVKVGDELVGRQEG